MGYLHIPPMFSRFHRNVSILWVFIKPIQTTCALQKHIISIERLNRYMHKPSEAPDVVHNNRPPPPISLTWVKLRFRSRMYCPYQVSTEKLMTIRVLRNSNVKTDQI